MEYKKKVLWVSNYNIEIGRGPMYRLTNMMKKMSELCELHLFSFGEIDECIIQLASKSDIKYTSVNYKSKGWFVLNATEIADKIVEYSHKCGIDIIVITWEIWDIIIATHKKLKEVSSGIPMATVFHSIPFAGMPERSTNYFFDIIKRGLIEKNIGIARYLFLKWWQAYYYIPRLNIITMTPTVEKRLKQYFKHLDIYTAYPGYAVNIPEGNQRRYTYDLVFMSRFERGKGIYELIDIVAKIKAKKNDIKLLMIGSFTFDSDRIRIEKKIKKLNLGENIIFTGWLNGDEKYEKLAEAKLFVYPSVSGDTFSISMLEAFATGKKVVCYDVLYSRMNYSRMNDIYMIKAHDVLEFAKVVDRLLIDGNFYSSSNKLEALNNYGSWDKVSEAEFECYHDIIRRKG